MDYRRAKEVLRDRRVELNLGVPELAKKAQVHKTTIYRMEQDIRDAPDRSIEFETIEQLVAALDLTLADFFTRVERLSGVQAGGKTESNAQALKDLAPEYQLIGHELRALVGDLVDEHLRNARGGESSRAGSQGARTKSARGRRR